MYETAAPVGNGGGRWRVCSGYGGVGMGRGSITLAVLVHADIKHVVIGTLKWRGAGYRDARS